jgi:hypothetical protein
MLRIYRSCQGQITAETGSCFDEFWECGPSGFGCGFGSVGFGFVGFGCGVGIVGFGPVGGWTQDRCPVVGLPTDSTRVTSCATFSATTLVTASRALPIDSAIGTSCASATTLATSIRAMSIDTSGATTLATPIRAMHIGTSFRVQWPGYECCR